MQNDRLHGKEEISGSGEEVKPNHGEIISTWGEIKSQRKVVYASSYEPT